MHVLRCPSWSWVSQKDAIRNEYIRGRVGVTSIYDRTKEHWLWWFGHVMPGGEEDLVKDISVYKLGLDRSCPGSRR